MLRGQMMDTPLLISSLIEHADAFHGDTEIAARTHDHPLYRATYRETHARTRRLARALEGLGVEPGERVATLAWNDHRHFELYYAISGMGAVCHTLNPRLFPEQLVYIVNHAEDALLAVDPMFLPLVEKLAGQLPGLRGILVLAEEDAMPGTALENVHAYETLLEGANDDFAWPRLDEWTASSLCYTSGTTGHPKGVLYSHRSTVLHSFAVCAVDCLGLSSRDVVLPVVPMFHANSWGLAYAAAMCGAKLAMPGPQLDGASLTDLCESEGVTMAAGVPTVWLGLLEHFRAVGRRPETLERVVIGGSAAPRSMIEEFETRWDIRVIHAWGMTETSPLGTVGTLKRRHLDLPDEERFDLQQKQGRGIYGVEMKIVDAAGKRLPHDGKAMGELLVRGPWTVESYFKGEGGEILDDEGFFPTGDVSTLDPEGFMQITDRAKDVIKSGGEWISSIDLENAAVGLEGVAEAAVIGLPHPKWDERPLLIVVPVAEARLTREGILDGLADKVAKWWLPDDVVFAGELPHTATGKISKKALRELYRDHSWPSPQEG